MVNSEHRIFKFSNGAEASASIIGVNKFVSINGVAYPFPSITLGARQTILSTIYGFTGWDMKKVKVVKEEYVCEGFIPDKQINFKVHAIASTPAYTNIEVYVQNEAIYKGRQKITFNSMKSIQNFAQEQILNRIAKEEQKKKEEEKKEKPKKEEKPKEKEIDPKLDKRIVDILKFFTKLGVSYTGEPISLESGYQEYCPQGNFRFVDKSDSFLVVFAKMNIFALDLIYELNEFESYDMFRAVGELSDDKKFALAVTDAKVNEYKHKVRFYNGLTSIAYFTKNSNSTELTKVLLLINFGRDRKQELIKRALKGDI